MSVDFNKIKEAVAKRDAFLAEHPELQPLQDKINEVLRNAGSDVHNRQAALQALMLDTWFQVVDVWQGKDVKK